MQKGTRERFGFVEIEHRGVKMRTSVGSPEYEKLFGDSSSQKDLRYANGKIAAGYEHRPDLIANLFMESPASWWVICERNAIFDVFEQLKPGEEIKLPL